MENAAQSGSGKKPQKKTPARPSSPSRKPAQARKPAPRTPAARKPPAPKPKPAAQTDPEVVEEEGTAPVGADVAVDETPEETAAIQDEVVLEAATPEDDQHEPEAEAEAEPEAEAEAEPEAEAEAEPGAEAEPDPEAEAEPEPESEAEPEADADTEPQSAPTISVPKLTVPKLSLTTGAIARASRAVVSRVKSIATPDQESSEKAHVDEAQADQADTQPADDSATAVEVDAPPADEADTVETAPAAAEAAGPVAVRSPRLSARTSTGTAPVLTVSGLTKRFDDTLAVDSIDLLVPAGAFYGIVGPNGAGKTTTLSMITGLLRPDAGTVTVHGADVWSDPATAKRNMGVLPDRLRLFDRLTGAQLLYYSGVLRGLSSVVAKERTADLAGLFGLEDSLGRLVSDYSLGMTKKVALAAALIHSPRLLVLDEPFESVDPVSASTVTEVLKNYVDQGGTVLLSSHSMELVERICDNVAVVVGGAILADGTVDEVRGDGTLEQRFVDLAGSRSTAEGLEWLHSFSD